MNPQTILIVVIIVLVVWLAATRKQEKLIPPWDLENCRAHCYAEGEIVPWDGGPKGPWDDPANFPSSNFDVSGCMAKCDLNTWYPDQY